MIPLQAPVSNDKLVLYSDRDIESSASPEYRTHRSKITSSVYKITSLLTKPLENGISCWIIGSREGVGKGENRGAGGAKKVIPIHVRQKEETLALHGGHVRFTF